LGGEVDSEALGAFVGALGKTGETVLCGLWVMSELGCAGFGCAVGFWLAHADMKSAHIKPTLMTRKLVFGVARVWVFIFLSPCLWVALKPPDKKLTLLDLIFLIKR
jgi:hypothetical protein